MTGGIFTFEPAEIEVSIVLKRYGKTIEIKFDRTGNIAQITYAHNGQRIMEHVREIKTVKEILVEVLRKPPAQNNQIQEGNKHD